MQQVELIEKLKKQTSDCINLVEGFIKEDEDKLQFRRTESSWNALQCIEHLNRYSEFYLKEFSTVLKTGQTKKSDSGFKSGYWGKQFTTGMLPGENMKTMKTFKSKDPQTTEVDKNVLTQFVKDQEAFLGILETAKNFDLNKNNCSITIPLIKMRLGDTLRFYTFHNIRHVDQAQRAIIASKL